MLRRTLLAGFPLAALAQFPDTKPPSRYEPSWDVLKRHPLPQWFDDAKLGIFIHWGLYSVPAWAPPSGELGKVDFNKWFYQNPYAEWYLNSIRLPESKTFEHHARTYGKDFDYYRFAATFNSETKKWDPAAWAKLFRQSGARYVVLTTKHHDGFTLWPSAVRHPSRTGLIAERDITGDLTKAVRAEGLRMGLYYSGGLDWTFETRPVRTMADVRGTVVQTPEYAAYADAHWRELMERYQPAILWNDIGYPRAGKLAAIFADFYNRQPDGLVNNRFGAEHFDFTTPEYSQYKSIVEKKWESCRGLGFSFGYNRVEGPEHVIAADKLIAMFVDIVSKNGNLLLNIGPAPDGSIPAIQMDRLTRLGEWLGRNGEGIFGSRPWIRAAAAEAGADVRFTRKGDAVYAFFLGTPPSPLVTIPNVHAAEGTRIEWLGSPSPLRWTQKGRHIEVQAQATGIVPVLKITPAPWQLVQA